MAHARAMAVLRKPSRLVLLYIRRVYTSRPNNKKKDTKGSLCGIKWSILVDRTFGTGGAPGILRASLFCKLSFSESWTRKFISYLFRKPDGFLDGVLWIEMCRIMFLGCLKVDVGVMHVEVDICVEIILWNKFRVFFY